MDQLKELELLLEKLVEVVDGKRIANVEALVDVIKAVKILVATFPDGPPDGG